MVNRGALIYLRTAGCGAVPKAGCTSPSVCLCSICMCECDCECMHLCLLWSWLCVDSLVFLLLVQHVSLMHEPVSYDAWVTLQSACAVISSMK